ncbi:MAG: hypothetical protein K1X78_16860 [Verrucomicrobiaceae bacterium]|nr:hypothetical protein [Verrucomicrobiaceae bacterium]
MPTLPNPEPSGTPCDATAQPLNCGGPAAAVRRAVRAPLLHTRSLITFVILHSSFCVLPAAPPPELTVLRSQYEKLLAERVTAPFDTARGELDAKFISALDRIADEAKKAGKLNDVLAILDDKKRLGNKFPMPDDDDSTPEALKKLRGIYRGQLQKLEEQRVANHGTILPAYTAKLESLETTLTKADRIDEARQVKDYREGLDAAITPRTAETMPPGEKTTTAASSASSASHRTFPPGDDRKAAQWAFEQAAWRVKVKMGDREMDLKKNEPLPAEPFEVIGIDINQQVPPKKPFKSLDAIAGLQKLRWLTIPNSPVEDADVDVLASFPLLNRIDFTQCRGRFTGMHLDRLAGLTAFESMNLEACPISKAGIKAIASLRMLKELNLDRTDTDDRDLAHLAQMTGLTLLRLAHTKTTSRGIASLKPLANLKELGWTPTPKKAMAELREIAAAFPDLGAFELRAKEKLGEEDVSGLSAFGKLKRLYVQNSTASVASLSAAGRLPALEYIRLYDTGKLSGAAFAPLAASTSLTFVQLELCPEVTDELLDHLAKIPSLRKVTLSRCAKITDAAIDAFKKGRPEVKVDR